MPDDQPNSWFTIKNAADGTDEAEILIYDQIGGFGVSANMLAQSLQGIKAKTVNVRLNTPGGNVFDGIAIFNALRAHPANIVVHVDGLAASAGSLVAMAGDEIRMAKNAYMMIHNPIGGVFGGAEDMRKMADTLDKVRDTIAQTYADRSDKKTRREFAALMAAETWLTAKEAKAMGLADKVTDGKGEDVRNATDPAVFNRVPAFDGDYEAVAQQFFNQINLADDGCSAAAITDPAPVNGPSMESTMSQTETTPATSPDAVAEIKPASIAELKAAYPTDPAFALECAEKALTLTESKAAYADVLAARLDEANAKLAEQVEVTATVGNPPLGGNAAEAGAVEYATVRAEFDAKVTALVRGGMDNMKAVRHAAKVEPELYQRMLDEANGKTK